MLKWTVTTKRPDETPLQITSVKNRRSLGILNGRTPRDISSLKQKHSRRSLGSCSNSLHNARKTLGNNKENSFTSTPCGNTQNSTLSLALRDVSNLTPNSTEKQNQRKRMHCESTSRPIESNSKRPPQYASTLPSYDIEYSPYSMKTAPYFALRGLGIADTYYENPRYINNNEEQSQEPPPAKKTKTDDLKGIITPLSNRLSHLRFSNTNFKRQSITSNQEKSLSSSLLGDTALEKMIDAILESAKKEKCPPKVSLSEKNSLASENNLSTSTYQAADDPASDLITYYDHLLISPSKYNEAGERTIIIDEQSEFNEREVKTPESCNKNVQNNKINQETPLEKSFCLKRRKAVRRKTNKFIETNERIGLTIPNGLPRSINSSFDEQTYKPKLIGLTLPNGIPSPETPSNYNILCRKSYDDLANMDTPKDFAINKNVNVNNNNSPEINETDLQGSSTPTGVLIGNSSITRRYLTFSPDCSQESSIDKRQSVASSTTSRSLRNTIVTGSLDLAVFTEENKLNVHVIRCRDLFRSNGSSVNAYVKIAILPSDSGTETGFQRTAVHRNSARPYFDHRFKFDIKDCDASKRIQLAVWHRDRKYKRSEFLGCMSFPVKNVLQKEINGSFKLQPQSCLTNQIQPIPITSLQNPQSNSNIQNPLSGMGENSQSSVEEAISIDDAGVGCGNEENLINDHGNISGGVTGSTNTGQTTIAFSKKAINQRDADENLFLRFLELDPPIEVVKSSDGNRRQSSFKHNAGRTPFTITKKLVRTSDKGFGFSIVWTHPPRIEKVETGLSADRCGIIPGDYVIFVDKHNVVTMPEIDILNLIRSQGNVLILEIFRRLSSSSYSSTSNRPTNGINLQPRNIINTNSNQSIDEGSKIEMISSLPVMMTHIQPPTSIPVTPSISTRTGAVRSLTACSSVETTSKRRLNLPQVTFSKESVLLPTVDDQRRKIILQLINREQNFVTALQFGIDRFVLPMRERKDIISPNDHRTLFQNIDELLRISEDILEQLVHNDNEPHLNFVSRLYLSKTTALCAAYKKYCNGLKRADCVLVNKSRNSNSDFMNYILDPPIPRKRPDLTTFIHRPLQHFREILKLIQITASHCRVENEEYRNFASIISDLQAAYREITVGGGLMEPLGEGRPLLTLQDLESRLVFTRCKPFVLSSPGRQWIFGGDLSRVEGRSIKPYWALLFSDILLFAKVSRDRVLFITEEPILLANITDSCFNVRKKSTEFRITIDPNGRLAESPTAHCAPDITRTPRRNSRRRSIILRAPSSELKAVWQNLLQRQIFLVNAALNSTPLSSPLESPDIMHTFLPLCDIGATTTSMASIKLSSLDSLPLKISSSNNHQVRSIRSNNKFDIISSVKASTSTSLNSPNVINTYLMGPTVLSSLNNNNSNNYSYNKLNHTSVDTKTSTSIYSSNYSSSNKVKSNIVNPKSNDNNNTSDTSKSMSAIPETISELPEILTTSYSGRGSEEKFLSNSFYENVLKTSTNSLKCNENRQPPPPYDSVVVNKKFVEFSLSSVGRSFIDDTENYEDIWTFEQDQLTTPLTPPPNVSPSSSSLKSNKFSETFSSDFNKESPSIIVSPINDDEDTEVDDDDDDDNQATFFDSSSWDLLELDIDFNEVNLDPSFGGDVEECIFFGDDPFGVLPCRPTPPDSLDL